ncbi:MAG: acetate--CoA ligase family protein [Melioribacteraceae bacterium]|nr:acetate--CoA ligase family protein [Melioribacteraceae bacterium]
MDSLKNFFYPKSICVAGASSKEKSIGYEILKTINSYGYTGKVFPVNPKSEEILGLKCFSSIEEIIEPIDLAIVVVPKQFAEATINSLLDRKCKSIILITAGFREIGIEGAVVEKRIIEKVKNAGARLVGPNCMGIINTLDEIKLNATFVAEKPETGSTGFLSQSGALGAAVLNSLRETDIKFAHFLSVGNKAEINENDILNYWESDDNISILTFYLESFVDGKEFILPFAQGNISKPVIVLKAGKTSGGMKAASSHTGALSSSDKIVDALLNQFGVIRVNDLNELFNTAKGFEFFPIPKGKKVAVVTNAGGPAILCVDKLEQKKLVLAELSIETKNKIREIIHPEGSVENPIDLLPGGNADTYKQVIELLIADNGVDSVISIFVEPVMVSPFIVVETINSINSEKPIMQSVMPMPEFWQKYRDNSISKKPIFRNPEDPAVVLGNMLFHITTKAKLSLEKTNYAKLFNHSIKKVDAKKGFLNQTKTLEMCAHYKIPTVKSFIIKPAEIESCEIDFYPIVVKGINEEVVHKSELNAVKLNISNIEELVIASKEISESFNKAGFEVQSFLIQQYLAGEHEILIGGFRDPSFGPIIMFGTGGKYVEVFDDTSMKSCYLSDIDVDELILSTKIGKILNGVRGDMPSDLEKLKSIIRSCAAMMLENENIVEFDLNPIIYNRKCGYVSVDARIKIM